MASTSTRLGGALLAGAVAIGLSACGGHPTQQVVMEADKDVMSTYEKFSGMPAGEDRQQALVDECRDEGALVVNSASGMVTDLIPAFEEKYGVDVSFVEPTSSESQRQRILQESRAGTVNADVLVTYTTDLALIYARENITAPYSSPITAELDDEVESENFMAIYQYPVVPQYNTNLVSEDDMVSSYEELADPEWKGKVGLVRGDGNWYFTLFDYLTREKGMSVEEFAAVFSGIAANSRAFEGHGTASLVAAGEVPMLLNGFQLFTLNLAEENAPISSEPPIEPVAMLQFGAGMTTTAKNPACAVLFSEWAITDGQQQVVDYNYYPVNFQALDEELPFSVEDQELAHMPVDSLTAEQFSEWEAAFENLVSGKEDILPEYVR